jgi:hypothetical protein
VLEDTLQSGDLSTAFARLSTAGVESFFYPSQTVLTLVINSSSWGEYFISIPWRPLKEKCYSSQKYAIAGLIARITATRSKIRRYSLIKLEKYAPATMPNRRALHFRRAMSYHSQHLFFNSFMTEPPPMHPLTV